MSPPAGEPARPRYDGRARVLALAPNAWDGQWMNRQQILSRLGVHHDVLYSTGAWTVWDRTGTAFRAGPFAGAFVRQDGILVDSPPRWLLRWPGVPAYDRAVLRIAQRRWRRRLDRLGSGPLVAYLFHPRYLPAIAHLRADHVVYQPYDLFRHMPGWSPTLAELERQLLRTCDAVIATSEPTREALQKDAVGAVHCVPNGVDGDLFLKPVASDDDALPGIPRPRIGYVGSLNRKVDLPLVAELARDRPDWQFVLIGPEGNFDEPTSRALADCRAMANVHFPGSRTRQELPACMASLDVALMCYRPGTWMDSAYPLKLHEYLASGPPVVSSDLPSVRPFASVVAIAREPGDWQRLIESALRNGTPGTPAERRSVAAENTWDQRVGVIQRILAEVCASGGPR